jgi:hypothetical protein
MKTMKNNNMVGGDGYSVGVNEVIGGRPSFPRYSSNYSPVFYGELLQNGAGIDKKCNCSKKTSKKDELIYNLIKQYQNMNNNQNGGSKENIDKITQFEAIKEVSTSLSSLPLNSVKKLITKLFLNNISENKQKTINKQLGGYETQFANILAPLGKNNLLVIASLLLLHYFAVEQKKETSEDKVKNPKKILKGGNSFIGSLNKILAPTGINTLGSVVILVLLQEAFVNNKKTDKKQSGGNPLKTLIAPLGTSAFIATGLLIVLQKLFVENVKYINTVDKTKKKMIGGKVNQKMEKLFNLIAPISFNVFTTKKTYKDITTKLSNMNNTNK